MREQKTCELHGLPLRAEEVALSYGLFTPDRELIAASRSLFPHSRFHVNGGCCVGEQEYAEVLVCPVCREAEIEWRKANGRPYRARGLAQLFAPDEE